MKIDRLIFLIAAVASIGYSWPFTATNTFAYGNTPWVQKETQILKNQAGNIDDNVLRVSLIAYNNARKHGYVGKPLLTVIDYSKPSYERRLWVFDLNHGRNLFNTWVTHGKNSGGVNATSFSNNPGSLKSSIGVFTTAQTYFGKNGYSVRLRGLESGVNDHAYQRAIVIHGARYVIPGNITGYGQVGRSWGCPAVSPSLARPLINTIKDDTLVVAYYPDRHWLSRSRFLNA